jgi:hypothetical protein
MTEPNMSETLWAWVTEEPNGAITLIGALMLGIGHMPLIGRDEQTMRSLEPFARAHGESHKQKIWMRRYTLAEEIGR